MRVSLISDTEVEIVFTTLPDYCPNTLTITLDVPDESEYDGRSIDPTVNMFWAHTDLNEEVKKNTRKRAAYLKKNRGGANGTD